ncbi:MAG: hypothetical protein KJ941_05800 [Bacteroidetes bacterium]|nr:hypothetical protein [Bacteroidota bacterium]
MTQAHLHLVLNHLPILGTLFGFVVLALGLLKGERTYQKIGLITLLLASLFIFPAFYTGEAAEHATERIVGSSHDMLEEHEELGEKALWASGVLAGFSLIVLVLSYRNRHIDYTRIKWVVLGWSAACLLLLFLTGMHGGKIRRPELRGEKPMMIEYKKDSHHSHKAH